MININNKEADPMRPIPTIEDPERYIDSAFVDSAFIELKSCDLWDVKMLYPILIWTMRKRSASSVRRCMRGW